MSAKKVRLRWSRDKKHPGLAGICHTPGHTLKADGVRCAHVSKTERGWHWVAGWSYPGVPHRNSAAESKFYIDDTAAKADAEAYVRVALAPKGTEDVSTDDHDRIQGEGTP